MAAHSPEPPSDVEKSGELTAPRRGVEQASLKNEELESSPEASSQPYSEQDNSDGPAVSGTQAADEPGQYDDAYEVTFSGPEDPDNPQSQPKWRKWVQVLITATTSTCVTCTSSLYTMTYDQLGQDLGASEELSTVGLSLFVFALGLSPMLLGPLSEFYGRRPIYTISTFFFIIWLIPCAVAPNMATMLVARFFDGFAGSAFLSVAGGTVGDLFTKMDLQLPMLVFTSSPL